MVSQISTEYESFSSYLMAIIIFCMYVRKVSFKTSLVCKVTFCRLHRVLLVEEETRTNGSVGELTSPAEDQAETALRQNSSTISEETLVPTTDWSSARVQN